MDCSTSGVCSALVQLHTYAQLHIYATNIQKSPKLLARSVKIIKPHSEGSSEATDGRNSVTNDAGAPKR